MKKTLLTLAVVAMAAAAAEAGVSHTVWTAYNAKNAGGTLIADGTYVVVVDLDGDGGWDGRSYTGAHAAPADNYSKWRWDAQDLVMDIGQILNGACDPFSNISSQPAGWDGSTTSPAGTGDHYYFLWFDVPFQTGLDETKVDTMGPGTSKGYGAIDCGVVGAFDGDYSCDVSEGNTFRTTNPEPATMALMLAGGGLMMALRRRRSR